MALLDTELLSDKQARKRTLWIPPQPREPVSLGVVPAEAGFSGRSYVEPSREGGHQVKLLRLWLKHNWLVVWSSVLLVLFLHGLANTETVSCSS
jgi:hypothetical protein